MYDAFRCDRKGDESEQDRLDREEAAEARLEAALTGGDVDAKPDAGDESKADKPSKKSKKAKGTKKKGDDDDDEEDGEPEDDSVHWPFHIVMALGGLYFGMLLTNWGSLKS